LKGYNWINFNDLWTREYSFQYPINAQLIMISVSNHTSHTETVVWRKPSVGRYKCNMDASLCTVLNKVGFDISTRDDKDRFVLAKIEWLPPLLDVDLRERHLDYCLLFSWHMIFGWKMWIWDGLEGGGRHHLWSYTQCLRFCDNY